MHTDLPNNLVVLENAPRDVDAVVVPIRPGHVLVDVGIDAGHAAGFDARPSRVERDGDWLGEGEDEQEDKPAVE